MPLRHAVLIMQTQLASWDDHALHHVVGAPLRAPLRHVVAPAGASTSLNSSPSQLTVFSVRPVRATEFRRVTTPAGAEAKQRNHLSPSGPRVSSRTNSSLTSARRRQSSPLCCAPRQPSRRINPSPMRCASAQPLHESMRGDSSRLTCAEPLRRVRRASRCGDASRRLRAESRASRCGDSRSLPCAALLRHCDTQARAATQAVFPHQPARRLYLSMNNAASLHSSPLRSAPRQSARGINGLPCSAQARSATYFISPCGGRRPAPQRRHNLSLVSKVAAPAGSETQSVSQAQRWCAS